MNLLVPIDFSDHSKAAAEYAASMVNVYEGNLHLLHVLVPINEEPDYLPVKTLQAKHNTVAEMYFVQEGLRKKFDVRTSCDLVPGDIAEQIIKAARRTKANLIVMPTQGNSGLKKFLYGSHTASVLEHSPVPVVALPGNYKFRPFQRFVYATDYNYSNIKDIVGIAKFAKQFDVEISLIHINKTNSPYSSTGTSREDFEALLENSVDYQNVTLEEFNGPDTADGLRSLLQNQQADMLIIPNKRKSLVEKITGRNDDDEFVFDLEVPLLVF
jgi:nucleotide-binding universal stress UspA family protein